MSEKRIVEGCVISKVGTCCSLKINSESPFRNGRNKTFSFSSFLKGLIEKRVRLTLEVIGDDDK